MLRLSERQESEIHALGLGLRSSNARLSLSGENIGIPNDRYVSNTSVLSATRRENATFSHVWSYFSTFSEFDRRKILVDSWVLDHGEFDGIVSFLKFDSPRIVNFYQKFVVLRKRTNVDFITK